MNCDNLGQYNKEAEKFLEECKEKYGLNKSQVASIIGAHAPDDYGEWKEEFKAACKDEGILLSQGNQIYKAFESLSPFAKLCVI